MKKIPIYLTTFLLFIIKPVLAAVPGPSMVGNPLQYAINLIQTVLYNLATLFGMNWVAGNEVAFMKMLMWILVFTLFYFAGQVVFSKGGAAKSGKKIALIVALVLATSTAILTPGELVVAMFSSYATLVMFIFMGASLGSVIWLIYGKWLKGIVSGPMLHVVRIFGLLLCWWILATITQFADARTGVTTFQYILPLIFIKYKQIKYK